MSFANYDLEAQTPGVQKQNSLLSLQKQALDASALDSIIKNTSHQIQTYGLLVASFNNERKLLGSRRDGPQLREKLDVSQQSIVSLGVAVRKLIGDINTVMSTSATDGNDVHVSNRQLVMKDRLVGEFNDLEENFVKSVENYTERAASIAVQPSKSSVPLDETAPLLGAGESNQNSGQQQFQVQENADTIEETELQYHILLTEERNRQIEQVAEGIREVNSIFKDLGELVSQQGEQLDTVEENVLQMSGNAHEASRELTKAHEHQKRKSKWSCILLVALCVFVLLMVLVVIS